MTRIQANLLLLLTAAIWGGGFIAQATALEHMGPNSFNALRFGLATLALAPFAIREHRRARQPMTNRQWRQFLVIGALLAAAQTAQQYGLMTTTVTNSSFLTGLYVVLVPLIAVLFLGHRPHWVVWPAALTSLLGIFLLSGGPLAALGAGDLLTMLCALLLAGQILLIGQVMATLARPLTLAATQFAVTALACGLLALGLESLNPAALTAALPQLLYGGLLSSGLAFSLQIIAQRHTSSAQAAIFMASEALFGALFGALILHESLLPIGYVGCTLLFAAMILVEIGPEWDRKRRLSR